MDFSAVASTLGSGGGTAAGDRSGLISTYETFLTLLTSQLRNQNPLEPLDANQFTEQLVQYSTVEQQIKTNDNLEAMLASLAASAAMSLVSYVGTTVTAHSTTSRFDGQSAQWSFSLEREAPESTVAIYDRDGALVHTEPVDLPAGSHHYQWDGRRADGTLVPPGSYTIAFDARDADGNGVPVATRITGRVDEIDMSATEPTLRIGGMVVPLRSVISVGM